MDETILPTNRVSQPPPRGCPASAPDISPGVAPCGCSFQSAQSVWRRGQIEIVRAIGAVVQHTNLQWMQWQGLCTLFHHTTCHFILQMVHISGELPWSLILHLLNRGLEKGGVEEEEWRAMAQCNYNIYQLNVTKNATGSYTFELC